MLAPYNKIQYKNRKVIRAFMGNMSCMQNIYF